ncbi:DUF3291 domain-containing protein [Streptomyces sp. NPDC046931]|uniref:DUF3291 domain-containing protein n=1 Tax=Streptomyces sp. NPDC046931 TaxID=3154806 RepID=UPI0033E5D90A
MNEPEPRAARRPRRADRLASSSARTAAAAYGSCLRMRRKPATPRGVSRALRGTATGEWAPWRAAGSPTPRALRSCNQRSKYAYAKAEPHRSVMNGLRSTMSRSVFTFWQVPAAELPLDWADARHRPAEQERRDAERADGPATAV